MGLFDKIAGIAGLSGPGAALGGAGLAIGAVGSIAQMISGASRANKAKKALENYQRQELKNVTAGMRVSTLGAELQTQEAQRRFATTVDALQSGGVRGLVGGLGQAEQAQQQQQQQIAADLDRQQTQIETMRAQDEARIRGMQESREQQDIAGMGAELAAGRQTLNAGISGLANTAMAGYQMSQPADKTMSNSQLNNYLGGSNSKNNFGGFNMPDYSSPFGAPTPMNFANSLRIKSIKGGN